MEKAIIRKATKPMRMDELFSSLIMEMSDLVDTELKAEQIKRPYHERSYYEKIQSVCKAKPKRIICSPPCTIILWDDDTKTVVKCVEGDKYSAEMGLALCILKKAMGNSYYNTIRKLLLTADYPPRKDKNK